MARFAPLWAVYRRVDRDDRAHLDLVGIVAAEFAHDATALAAMLPEAPKYPVVSHALALTGRVPSLTVADLPKVAPEAVPLASRRTRKRAAAAAVAQANGRAA